MNFDITCKRFYLGSLGNGRENAIEFCINKIEDGVESYRGKEKEIERKRQ